MQDRAQGDSILCAGDQARLTFLKNQRIVVICKINSFSFTLTIFSFLAEYR